MPNLSKENISQISNIIINILHECLNNQYSDKLSLRENLHFWLEYLAEHDIELNKIFSREIILLLENFLEDKTLYQTGLNDILNIIAENNQKIITDSTELGKQLEELIALTNIILLLEDEPSCGYGSLIDNILVIIEYKVGITYSSNDLSLKKRILLLKEYFISIKLSKLAELFDKLAKEVERKKCEDYKRSNFELEQAKKEQEKQKKKKRLWGKKNKSRDEKDKKNQTTQDHNLNSKDNSYKAMQIMASMTRIRELINNNHNKKNIADDIAQELSNIEKHLGLAPSISGVSIERIKGIKSHMANMDMEQDHGENHHNMLDNFNHLSLENDIDTINQESTKDNLKNILNKKNITMKNLTINKKSGKNFTHNVLSANKTETSKENAPSMNFILQNKKDKGK